MHARITPYPRVLGGAGGAVPTPSPSHNPPPPAWLPLPSAGRGWSDDGPSPGTLGDGMERSATPQLSPTIRAGWLDKNPPQG